jgi:hypothetical protein
MKWTVNFQASNDKLLAVYNVVIFEQLNEIKWQLKEDLATKEDLANHCKALKYHFIKLQLIFFLAFNAFLIAFLKFYLKAL